MRTVGVKHLAAIGAFENLLGEFPNEALIRPRIAGLSSTIRTFIAFTGRSMRQRWGELNRVFLLIMSR